MKAFLHFLSAIALLFMPVVAMAQTNTHGGQTFMDKAIWFIVPGLALVVIVLMIRNRRQIANQPEDED